jgi:flagellar biosynthesis protein FlhA
MEAAAEEDAPASPDQINLADVTDYSPVSVQLGYGLIEMVDEDTGGPLINRITGIRKQVSRALGFVVPPVRVRDDMALGANEYRIRIGQSASWQSPAIQPLLKCPALR